MCRFPIPALSAICLMPALGLAAQTPIALPYSITTLAGTSPMTAAAGTQCPNLPSGIVSTDAFGDGCLAVNAVLGNNSSGGPFSGVTVDPAGDVFMNDDINGVLHMINPNSKIMTLVAGGGTACSTKVDSSGDGCVAATGTPTTPVADARGIGIDPYGNVLLAGFNDHFVHLICRAASPLCGSGAPSASTPIQIPIGNMGLVAGCAFASGSSGVSGVGADNTPAFTTATVGFSGSPFVNAGGSSSACTASLGEVDQPRGATADAYGNVYFADTTSERWRVVLGPQSYNGVTNPLWAVLEQNPAWFNGSTLSLQAGFVYTVAGASTTATTKGASCAGGGTAIDSDGDGCLFTAATVFANTGDAQGVGVDAAGNMIFTDAGHGLLRVLFVNGAGQAGAAMANAIEANNAGMSPSTAQPGFVYSLAGGGGTGGVSTTPALGSSRTALDSSTTKLTVSPQGNVFIGDKTRVLFFDINTGFIRILFTSAAANVIANSFCSGSSGPVSLSAFSDGCPASDAEFGNSNGLSVGVDGMGNLYFDDGNSNTSQELVRKVVAQGFAPQTLKTAQQQIFEAHIFGATSSASSSLLSATPDIVAGSPACTLNGDRSVDCTVAVTSKPSAVGLRGATLTVANASSGEDANIALDGKVSGSAVAFDNASTVANNVTTAIAPTTIGVFGGIVPSGVALDSAGNVYAANGTSIVESIGGTIFTPSTPSNSPIVLPATPSQIAIDPVGNIFAVNATTGSIDELTVAAAGKPSSYVLNSISYAPCSGCTAAPQAVAADSVGNVYVADVQNTQANTAIYKLTLIGGTVRQQTTVAIGFVNPVSIAVDAAGNVYVADKSAGDVFKLAPSVAGPYEQTTLLTGAIPVGVATDAAGDVYVQDERSASVIEVPVSGPETPVLTGLQSPVGIAVDGLGNVYSADAKNTSITQIVRNAGVYGSTTTPVSNIAGTLTNVGNLAATGEAQTASAAFTFSTEGCTIGSVLGAGQACQVSAAMSSTSLQTPGAAFTDTLSVLTAPSIGSVTFNDVVPAGPTSTTLMGPATVLFAASGSEATFTVSVSGLTSPATSQVTFTVSSIALSGNTVVFSSTPTLNASGSATVTLSGLAPGNYSITASYAGVLNSSSPSTASSTFTVEQFVATGDTRTITEPSFPAVCTVLNAALTMVNNDIPTAVDATVTNPDGARIQAALNGCAGTKQAVELSTSSSGNNAFLSGPLSMPSGVTLLVDPGVVLFFSRNVQDYDTTPGTHTCGTVNNNSATASCLPLIDIPSGSSNVGIMGFGKLDGRGGDTLINAFPASFAGQSWYGLSSIANGGGNQQNPRFVQMDTGSSNITLYKITIRNSPLFHVSTTGAVSNFTAWDVKIVTPTSSRNTDGIDPGNATNFTITHSWISDGDDNVAVGAAGTTSPASNISVTNNRFFAGHGESIGSFTEAGVSNVLFDSNMLSGNGIAGAGSSIDNTADSNSTGIRIKSGYDRGGLVTNIQYSNSCFQDHKAEVDFNPNFEDTTGTANPNFTNILMQNLTFLSEGTTQFTGTNNNGTIFPLGITLDNVSFPSVFPASELNPAPTNVAMSYGPGPISSDFIGDYATFVGSNGDTLSNNITEASLNPPQCRFTYIAPELTGPNGLPQTIIQGQNATAVVILTPAVGGAAFPTGTVTLTDAFSSNSTTVPLPGDTDTLFIPLTGLAPGVHTFTATYSGDANYTLSAGQTVYSTTEPYVITVSAGSLGNTATTLTGVPTSIAFGASFIATAAVAGSNPSGTVEFVIDGSVFATSTLSSGTATASINLPFSTIPYNIDAIYSGDAANDGSTSAVSSVTVTPAFTTTAMSANTTATTLGHPVALTAMVSSTVGAPTGVVTFTFTTSGNATPQAITAALVASATPNVSIATAGVDLPIGTDNVTATYVSSGSFSGSASAPMQFIVTQGKSFPLPSNPIALPFTMTTLAGGAQTNCAASTDSFGDGCPATSIVFGGSVDLRSVAADPFGNVYLTDAVASVIRRIAPNGIISGFAGRISGTTCAPTATVGCPPTQVSLKARGVSSDAQGNIYIAGYNSNEVFKVSVSTGLLYLVAGTGSAGSSGDGSPATLAEVNAPRGVWADSVGNVYIADTSNNKIRVVDITGNIQTFAGTGTASSSGDGGLATSATIDNPQGVMTDANLNVYIADSQKVRVVCVTCGTNSPLDSLLATLGIASAQNGNIYTIAGGGGSSGPFPTLATNVSMSPQKLAIDTAGNIYISDGAGAAWFLDAHTAFIRPIAGLTSTNCSTATDKFGDGCPATQAVIGDGGNGIGVGTDVLGNFYISDTLNARIRKVTTGLASPTTAVAATASQPVELHFIAGDNLTASNGLSVNSSEWSLAQPACTTNPDATADCLLLSSFTPAVPGARSTGFAVNSSQGNTAFLGLTGAGLGAGATLDPATQISFGSGLAVAGIAADNAGNVYVSDSDSKQLFRFTPTSQTQGGSAAGTPLASFEMPGAVAIDPRGYIYVADTAAGMVTAISPAGAATVLPFTFSTPSGLAVDALNNLYVSDSSAKAVYQIDPITNAQRILSFATLTSPEGLSIDPNGNLLVADPGVPAIYRYSLQTDAAVTVATPAVAPTAALADAAGNLLIADSADILAVPTSSNSASFTVASITPASLAIDSAGDLYTGAAGGVLKLVRTQGRVQFSSSESPQTVKMLESGNQVFSGSSFIQTDTSDFSLMPTDSTDCTLNSSGAGMLAIGGVCALTAAYTPKTFALTTDRVTFNGNLTNAGLSTPSSVQLTLSSPSFDTAISLQFASTELVFPGATNVTVCIAGATQATPTGTIQIDDGATTLTTLTLQGNGCAYWYISPGLNAGMHSITALYSGDANNPHGTSAPVVLNVSPVPVELAVSCWNASFPYGGNYQCTVNVSSNAGSAQGNISYAIDSGPAVAAAISNGNAQFTIATPIVGNHTVVIGYAQQTNFAAATPQTETFTVTPAPINVALTPSTYYTTVGTNITFSVSVTSFSAGPPNDNGTVSFSDGATSLATVPVNSSGQAIYSTSTLPAGTQTITLTYSGGSNYASGSASATITLVQ